MQRRVPLNEFAIVAYHSIGLSAAKQDLSHQDVVRVGSFTPGEFPSVLVEPSYDDELEGLNQIAWSEISPPHVGSVTHDHDNRPDQTAVAFDGWMGVSCQTWNCLDFCCDGSFDHFKS